MPTSVDPASPTRQAPKIHPIPGVIQFGSVNLLAGAPGVGKTALTATLLRQLRDGEPIFETPTCTPPRIAYLCADRGWETAQTWLERAGFPDIIHYSLTDDDDFDDNKLHNKRARLVILRECLDKLGDLPRGSFVCVDPIALFMGGNLLDYDTCAIFLIGIRKICRARGITILGLGHASKQKNDKKEQYRRLQDRILGSAAQHGYGDTQMYLAAPEETGEDFYTFLWQPHLRKPEYFKLMREEESGLFIPWDGRSATPAVQAPPALTAQPYHPPSQTLRAATQTAEEGKLLAAIPAELPGVGFGELIAQFREYASRATIYRYLQQLLSEGIIVQPTHGRYMRAPQH